MGARDRLTDRQRREVVINVQQLIIGLSSAADVEKISPVGKAA